jgi:D-alanyl-D-alanine carboxypeptidase (penicillin-binding protein 5/6)
MRKWTVIAALLVAMAMLIPASAIEAKQAAPSKKSDKQVQSASKPTSGKAAASSSKSLKKETKSQALSKQKGKTAVSGKQSPAKTAEAEKPRVPGKKGERSEAQAKPVPAPESYRGEFGVATKSAMVMDANSGRVLFAQEPDMPIAPASLTKVLTLYLVNERLRNGTLKLDAQVPVSEEASHAGGSNMRLKAGQTVSLEDLIKGIAVASANDGSIAVAQYLGGGDMAPFVEEMNKKAKELGMASSQFFNPNGLPADGQQTTARDMAILSKAYLEKFPESLAIHSMTEFMHNNRIRHNSNTLLGRVEGVDGLKTGFVCASGFNIVVTAKRGDTRLVAVVLGARNRGVRAREATRLVEEGFKIIAAEKSQGVKQVAMYP